MRKTIRETCQPTAGLLKMRTTRFVWAGRFSIAPMPARIAEVILKRGTTTRWKTLIHRMSQYEEHTAPLIEYYEVGGLLRRIDAARAPEEVSAQIEAVFETLDTATQSLHQEEAAAR